MKGQKTGGRQKGTPNKISAEVRQLMYDLLAENTDLIMQDFRNMTTEQRMVFIPKILPYLTPKMKPVSEDEEQKLIAQQLSDYCKLAGQVAEWEQQEQLNQNQNTVPDEHPVQPLQTTPEPTGEPVNDNNEQQPSEATAQHLSQQDAPDTDQQLCQDILSEFKRRLDEYDSYEQLITDFSPTTASVNTDQSPKTQKKATKKTPLTTHHAPFYKSIPAKRKLKKRR